ncbi:MAG: YlbF family regulator [Lachnospiraceae bacterium]|nr:YlbF family regulator [Lachnospiraceae bacterium]
MISDELAKAADTVSEAIKQTPEYRGFTERKKLANLDPETKALIDRARDLQTRLMEIPEEERNSDHAERLQEEYEEVAENTAVYEYSRAEALYMTMIQEVLGRIIENVDIDI